MRFLYTSFAAASIFLLGTVSFAQVAGASTSAYCPQVSATVVGRGASGSSILEIQKFLSDYYNLAPARIQTSYFGIVTQAYVMKYQKEKGLPPVGSVGSLTLKSIRNNCKSNTPSITTISPTAGPLGTSVTITGTNFTTSKIVGVGASTVGTTGGVPLYSEPNNQITFKNKSTGVAYSVNSPQTSPNGTTLNFNLTSCPSHVGTAVDVVIMACQGVIIPAGEYAVTVKNTNGTSNAVSFTVTNGQTSTLSITSLTPVSGPVESRVLIQGTGFTKTDNTVNFGGSLYSGLASDNGGTTISFTVPATTNPPCRSSNPPCMIMAARTQPGSYPVSVTNTNGTSNSVKFVVTDGTTSPIPPTITTISPTSGPQGTAVTITGTGFALGGGSSTSGDQMFITDPIAVDNTISFKNRSTGSVYSVNSPQRSSNGTTLKFTLTSCPPVVQTGDAVIMSCAGVYLPSGEYTVTVTNSNGTSNSVSFTIVDSTSTTNSLISVSRSAESVAQGKTITFSWSTQNAPANAAVVLSLENSSGAEEGRIAGDLPLSGSYTWTLPGSACDSKGLCMFMSDNPYVWATTLGTHRIVARLYTPKGGLSGGLIPGSPDLTVVATAYSENFTITEGQTSSVPTITTPSPTAGIVGSTVTISGTNFTPTGNTINFKVGSSNTSTFPDSVYPGYASTNSTTISFEVPQGSAIACQYGTPPCPPAVFLTQPGTYTISVSNANGESNSATYVVTATGTTINPGQPTI